ncbi:MAG: YkgJ family cysteine cluster protein [Planctomycetaceae bacterium]|nr:YkgJ family cysteine cluster protein [Planctomycetaceae bacterium]
MPRKNNNCWYAAGLHFECQQCGNCCSGPEEGVIWIKKQEIEKLAEHLNMTPAELHKKYLRRIGLRITIKEDQRTKDCIFLRPINGSKGCSIYNFRPAQCRTWPFWEHNLYSPDDWNAAAQKCSGINKGRLYTFDEIEERKNM